MTAYPRAWRFAHRVVLGTAHTPLRWVWLLGYGAIGSAGVAFFIRGERDITVYLRRGATTTEFLPGLSDLDLVLVAASREGACRVRERRDRLLSSLPATRALLDRPLVYCEAEMGELAGSSAFTHGLEPTGAVQRDCSVYFGVSASVDAVRTVVLPGLEPAADGWRRLAGRERRVSEPARDTQAQRIAVWLELSNWWRIVFTLCTDPGAPNAAAKCVKLVADTAAAWLRLAHDEVVSSRQDALRRALVRAPEESDALRRALDLQHVLTHSPAAPLAELLPAVARFSARIVDLLARGTASAGVTEVRLAGAGEPAGKSEPLPLCDWAALVWPVHVNEWFRPEFGDLGDPAVIAAAVRAHRIGTYTAVRNGDLMVLPAVASRDTRLRAIKCRTTDPVPFALADAMSLAAFPELAGWSALDTARRAAAEHRAWLRTGLGPVAAAEAPAPDGLELTLLLTAARAGLFLESVLEGEPLLTLTAQATTARLGQRSTSARAIADDTLAAHREAVRIGRPAAVSLIAALRAVVLELPPYAQDAAS